MANLWSIYGHYHAQLPAVRRAARGCPPHAPGFEGVFGVAVAGWGGSRCPAQAKLGASTEHEPNLDRPLAKTLLPDGFGMFLLWFPSGLPMDFQSSPVVFLWFLVIS